MGIGNLTLLATTCTPKWDNLSSIPFGTERKRNQDGTVKESTVEIQVEPQTFKLKLSIFKYQNFEGSGYRPGCWSVRMA